MWFARFAWFAWFAKRSYPFFSTDDKALHLTEIEIKNLCMSTGRDYL